MAGAAARYGATLIAASAGVAGRLSRVSTRRRGRMPRRQRPSHARRIRRPRGVPRPRRPSHARSTRVAPMVLMATAIPMVLTAIAIMTIAIVVAIMAMFAFKGET